MNEDERDGYNAYLNGLELDDNPHAGTDTYAEESWVLGWYNAAWDS